MNEIETEAKVIKVLENSGEPDDLIRLSTGVVLRGLKANTGTLISVIASFPRPRPPVQPNKIMGRDMENPLDPDYISQVQAWQTEQGNAMITAFILLGTELESKPKGMPGPGDKAWLEDYELLGLPMRPENKRWCYLTWVKFKAATEDTDIKLIQEVVGRLSGVSKKDVAAAEEFRGGEEAG